MSPSYRTEIVVAADRYVCLQLPEGLPEGRATVTVTYPEVEDVGLSPTALSSSTTFLGAEPGEDRDDVEWWDEFEGGPASAGG